MFCEALSVTSDTWHMIDWFILIQVSNGGISQTNERKSKGRPCVKPLEREIQVLDKEIR